MAVLVLAVLVGMFQGGVQALSRSHFAKIIPAEKSGEYFGLFDICGKGASFLGTMIVSVGSQLTGSAMLALGCWRCCLQWALCCSGCLPD